MFDASSKAKAVVDAAIGHAVAFAGPLKHAGFPVTKGSPDSFTCP